MEPIHTIETSHTEFNTFADLAQFICKKTTYDTQPLSKENANDLAHTLLVLSFISEKNNIQQSQTPIGSSFYADQFHDVYKRTNSSSPQQDGKTIDSLLQTAINANLLIKQTSPLKTERVSCCFPSTTFEKEIRSLGEKILRNSWKNCRHGKNEFLQWHDENSGIRPFDPSNSTDIQRLNEIENDPDVIREFGEPTSLSEQKEAAASEKNEREVYIAVATKDTVFQSKLPDHEIGEMQGWIRFIKDRENIPKQLQNQDISAVQNQLREYFNANPEPGKSVDESVMNRLHFRKQILSSYEAIGPDRIWERSRARSRSLIHGKMTSATNLATLHCIQKYDEKPLEKLEVNQIASCGIYAAIHKDNIPSLRQVPRAHLKYIGDVYEYMEDEQAKKDGIMIFVLDENELKSTLLSHAIRQ